MYFFFTFDSSSGGKLVDATPKQEKSLQDELDKITSGFSAAGKSFADFPSFNYQGL